MLSEWGDLNSRPLDPQSSALTGLRYTPKDFGLLDPSQASRGGGTTPRMRKTVCFKQAANLTKNANLQGVIARKITGLHVLRLPPTC